MTGVCTLQSVLQTNRPKNYHTCTNRDSQLILHVDRQDRPLCLTVAGQQISFKGCKFRISNCGETMKNNFTALAFHIHGLDLPVTCMSIHLTKQLRWSVEEGGRRPGRWRHWETWWDDETTPRKQTKEEQQKQTKKRKNENVKMKMWKRVCGKFSLRIHFQLNQSVLHAAAVQYQLHQHP